MLTRKLLTLGLAALLATACADEPPELPKVAEPETALRPEAQRGEVREEARIADYVLDASLDTETNQVEGSARVTWRNTTERSVTTLPFHLYMNAFRAEDTAWMRTSAGRHRGNDTGRDTPWGYTDVRSVKLERPGSLVVEGDPEAPGEAIDLPFAEDADPTTMTVTLPEPVGPGESVTVALDFTTQFPEVYARTGFEDDFYAGGQWFPKLAVLEDDGWDAHTFTVNDEFYADFGNYNVFLDVPEDMVVGASGIRKAEEIVDGRKHLTYEAEMVHDFAWFADPDFVEHYGEYHGIRIRQLIQPEHVEDAEIHMEHQIAALESYERRFGPYPWSTITIVHAPEGAEGAGGMEYPTLYTTSDRAPLPGWVRRTLLDERMSGVGTTVHEFGHQYFQGLFASREHTEPWLDEGVNSFSNVLAMLDHLGDDPWIARLLGHKLYRRDVGGLASRFRGFLQPVALPASAFTRTLNNYGTTVYGQTANLLWTLRNLTGAEDFDSAFAVYCERARFAHPEGHELEAALVEGLGSRRNLAAAGEAPVYLDVERFLEQALHSTREIDFEVVRIANQRRLGEDGWHRGEDGALQGGEPPPEDEPKRKKRPKIEDLPDEEVEGILAVQRAGDFEVPVEILVTFADDSEERLLWDARDTATTWTWPGRRVRHAALDPGHKLVMERDRIDNVAFASDQEKSDGLSRPLGDFGEALALVVLGGLAP